MPAGVLVGSVGRVVGGIVGEGEVAEMFIWVCRRSEVGVTW